MRERVIVVTAEQADELVVTELENALLDSWGIPEKTKKAILKTYKWFANPSRMEAFLRDLKEIEDY